MNEPQNQLFRKEVLDRRINRLHGDVSLAVPISWQLIGFALFVALVASILFLSLATYSRVENVTGLIVLDRGVASIIPTRAGIVSTLDAREGQRVEVGAKLANVQSEESMVSGSTAPRRVIESLNQKDVTLAAQSSLITLASVEARSRLAEQIAGLTREIDAVDNQIASQQRLVEVAGNEFRSVTGVAQRGFISQRDLGAREEVLLARRQQLSQLEQSRAAKSSLLAEARRGIAQAAAAAQAQAAEISSRRAEVAQQLADAEAARGYTVIAPIAGTLTAVTARVGQPVNPEAAIMVVMPDGATQRAELYVPTNAVGFLAVDQEVRLAVDAFPYQRYGTVAAKILEISSVAIPRTNPDGRTTPVYLLTAKVIQPWVLAFGRRQPLLPGMTLTARIVIRKQTLLEWLFEPLFAVRGR